MNAMELKAWKEALLATAGLAAAIFAANLLWQLGHPQWAFVLSFVATWALVASLLSAVQHTDQSGLFLARIVDRNFEDMHERLRELEKALEANSDEAPEDLRRVS